MAVNKWNLPDSVETILTTTLNELADGANKITASAVSNDQPGELDMNADFTLCLTEQGDVRSAGAYVALYILPQSDGTNFPYGGDALDPSPNHWRGNFVFDAAVTARYDVIEGVLLPPMDFHVLLMNETGQAFAAAGNTLTMRRYNTQSS